MQKIRFQLVRAYPGILFTGAPLLVAVARLAEACQTLVPAAPVRLQIRGDPVLCTGLAVRTDTRFSFALDAVFIAYGLPVRRLALILRKAGTPGNQKDHRQQGV